MATPEVKTKHFIQTSLFVDEVEQNYLVSDDWGKVYFHEAKTNKWKDTCRHCLLWNGGQQHECDIAPCTPDERRDHKEGYFSIQQFPFSNTDTL